MSRDALSWQLLVSVLIAREILSCRIVSPLTSTVVRLNISSN